MEYKVKLLPPLMPNFIRIEQVAKSRQDDISDHKIRVCELTDGEAEQYGELMKQKFIQHHKEHVKRNLDHEKPRL